MNIENVVIYSSHVPAFTIFSSWEIYISSKYSQCSFIRGPLLYCKEMSQCNHVLELSFMTFRDHSI